METSQGMEVRTEEGNRTGFITRKDDTGRASGWARPGNLGSGAGSWGVMACGRGRVKDHTRLLAWRQERWRCQYEGSCELLGW